MFYILNVSTSKITISNKISILAFIVALLSLIFNGTQFYINTKRDKKKSAIKAIKEFEENLADYINYDKRTRIIV